MSSGVEKKIDSVKVLDSGILEVRQSTVISSENEEPVVSYQRWTIEKNADVSDQDPLVQNIAQAAWQ